jgi:hypothetical protein
MKLNFKSMILILIYFVNPCFCQDDLMFYDTVGDNSAKFGAESLVTDWAALATVPATALPPAFTICSSLSVPVSGNTDHMFYQLLKVDLDQF